MGELSLQQSIQNRSRSSLASRSESPLPCTETVIERRVQSTRVNLDDRCEMETGLHSYVCFVWGSNTCIASCAAILPPVRSLSHCWYLAPDIIDSHAPTSRVLAAQAREIEHLNTGTSMRLRLSRLSARHVNVSEQSGVILDTCTWRLRLQDPHDDLEQSVRCSNGRLECVESTVLLCIAFVCSISNYYQVGR